MKLAGAAASRFFRSPGAGRPGVLIYGGDAMRVALRRQELIAGLIGPLGDEEMRLTRMSGGDLRKDPAALLDAVTARSFFPGQRVAFVEEANDGAAPAVGAALRAWKLGDAVIVVTAGSLTKASALKKLFEDHAAAAAIALYDDPPSREEIEAALKDAGLRDLGRETMRDIEALAQALDPGDFRQTVEKLAVYKFGDASPVTPEDVAAVAPATTEAELDEILEAAADGRADQIGPLMRRLDGQGVQATSLCISALRHFRALHTAASDPGGPGAGLARLRPPIFGPRRDRMQRQASAWGMHRLEMALAIVTDTDLTLRSSSRVPAAAMVERMLVRLAMLGAKGR